MPYNTQKAAIGFNNQKAAICNNGQWLYAAIGFTVQGFPVDTGRYRLKLFTSVGNVAEMILKFNC